MTKRNDPHRKGAIIPGDYHHWLSYNLSTQQDGWPIPAFGVNCEIDRRTTDTDGTVHNGQHDPDGRCCVIGAMGVHKMAAHGGTGQCTACGAHFVYGEMWRHEPTGEMIHVGHICGEKYGLLVDRSAFELEAGRRAAAVATKLLKEQKAAERAEFLADYPGLEEALKADHYIVADIASRFRQYCSLSEKQVELVLKIADRINNPPPAEDHVPAPEGKQTFTGTVVSAKWQESDFSRYGGCVKITVKVATTNGTWLAWGTAPAAILDAEREDPDNELKGSTVEITATLTRSDRDQHFCFFKRPRGRVLEFAKAA